MEMREGEKRGRGVRTKNALCTAAEKPKHNSAPVPFLDYRLMLDSPKNNIQKHVTTLY